MLSRHKPAGTKKRLTTADWNFAKKKTVAQLVSGTDIFLVTGQ